MDNNVDEKYYIGEKTLAKFIRNNQDCINKGTGYRFASDENCNGVAKAITIKPGNRMQDKFIKQVGNLFDDKERGFKNPQTGRVYDVEGLSPTLNTMQGGGREPKVIQINPEKSSGGKQPYQQDRIYDINGIKDTLGTTNVGNIIQDYRIRKLTERECFRLIGLSEDNIDKIQSANISKTQQYKMAGNSIVVDCLYYIFKSLFYGNQNEETQPTLF